MTPVVEIRDAFRIHRSAGSNAVALQGLSLDVAAGEIVVVLGPSGAGKTTMLRAVGGFEPLTSGSIRVLGQEVGILNAREIAAFRAKQMGILDQHYARALSPELTCLQTVALGRQLLGLPRNEALVEAEELLERVGLRDRAQAKPHELSGGEQQRVAVCAAVVNRPPLLLADEPAGELDEANARTIYRLIEKLVRNNCGSALIVSHDQMAAEVADRLIFIYDGRVVEEQRRGLERAVVVNRPGWVRLPDPILELVGDPTRFRAIATGDGVLLEPLEKRAAEELESRFSIRTPPVGDDAIVNVRHLSKTFDDSDSAPIVDLSYSFNRSSLTAVLGRSGSGKTTLLHMIAGLELPTSGEVTLAGATISAVSRAETAELRRKHLELISQEPGLVPHLTAQENVELGLQIRGVRSQASARAAEALSIVGLKPRASHRADRLSAGERQRVAIARALAARPDVLLADEPTARLDRKNALMVAELLRTLTRDIGSAVICATHDPDVVEIADATLDLLQARHQATHRPDLKAVSS